MTTRSVTRSAAIRGQQVDYELALEMLPLRTAASAEIGEMSAFSFVRLPVSPARPVLFLTNGGPGSASAYLLLSGIGPLRAEVPADLSRGALPPYGIGESPTSVLDVADLVIVDAPRTGLGSVDPAADMSDVYSVEGDGRVFSDAFAAWVRRHGRWSSPKFFLGESYGTHRAAFLAPAVHATGAPLDGIALLGQAVNIQEVAERPGNVTGALANLPYKAAVAWFHGRGSQEHGTVEGAVQAALDHAWGPLALAMLQGTALPGDQLRAEAERLSRMIGIPVERLVQSRLWMSKGEFRSTLLADEGLSIGAQDSRYTLRAHDAAAGESPIDASSTQLQPRYAAAIDALLGDVLGLEGEPAYRFFDPLASREWEWADSGSRSFMTMGRPSPFQTYPYPAHLSRWMKQAPQARLFIGTGIYDSLTTIGAADHLVRQWDLPRDRVVTRWYRGGHMMYSDADASVALNDDLRAFVTGGAR